MGESYSLLGKPTFRVFNPRSYVNFGFHPVLTLGLSNRVPRRQFSVILPKLYRVPATDRMYAYSVLRMYLFSSRFEPRAVHPGPSASVLSYTT